MRYYFRSFFCLLAFCAAPEFLGQQTTTQSPRRDPEAVFVLQQSLTSMGGVVPSDSVATGNVTIVAGSKTETGTIQILTRGRTQSAEHIQTTESTRAVVYSGGAASEREGTATKSLQLELAVSSHSPNFPLLLLAEVLNDATSALLYLGLETNDSAPAQHIRFWKTFSEPNLQHLSEFSAKDIWIDAATGLPRKLAYMRRAAGGAEPAIPVETFYSDYRDVGGVLYPFQVRKSLNGTPWAAITIDSVALNTGLTDADFPVR